MKVKFTVMIGQNWATYSVADRRYCKSEFDKKLWDQLADMPGEKCIQMGKTCIERLDPGTPLPA
jgi:hypothetical protein